MQPMDFLEDLPAGCPPDDAKDCELPEVYRLLTSDQVSSEDFLSQAALGVNPPKGMDLCRWASCSLVLDAKIQKKLPKFKDTHHFAAMLRVPAGAGKSRKSGKNHYDFWCANEFDITGSVVEVIGI